MSKNNRNRHKNPEEIKKLSKYFVEKKNSEEIEKLSTSKYFLEKKHPKVYAVRYT